MLIMHWFGETDFTPERCGGKCDVCAANADAGISRPEGEGSLLDLTWLASWQCCFHIMLSYP